MSIFSDDELKISLTEMKGKINKYSVDVFPISNDDESTEKGEHPGVFCDECKNPVYGFRYTCITCPDYNLCSECEKKGQHSDHHMIRIPRAQDSWPQHLFVTLHKIFDSENCSCRGGFEDDTTKSPNQIVTNESTEDSSSFRDEPCEQNFSSEREDDKPITEQDEVDRQQHLDEDVDAQSEAYTMIVYGDEESSSASSVVDEEHDKLERREEHVEEVERDGHEKVLTNLEGPDDHEDQAELKDHDNHDEIEGHNDHEEFEVDYVNVERPPNRKESQGCLVNINNINKPDEQERDESNSDETQDLHVVNLNVSAQNEKESKPSKPPRAASRTKHDGKHSDEVQQIVEKEQIHDIEDLEQAQESESPTSPRTKTTDVPTTPITPTTPVTLKTPITPTILTTPVDKPTFEAVPQNMVFFPTDDHDDDEDGNLKVSTS